MMTILRSGATKTYSDNWAKAFGKSKQVALDAGAKSKMKTPSIGKKKSVKAKKSKK